MTWAYAGEGRSAPTRFGGGCGGHAQVSTPKTRLRRRTQVPGRKPLSARHQSLALLPACGACRPELIKYLPQVRLDVFYGGSVRAPGNDEQMLAQIADVCHWRVAGGPPGRMRQAAAFAGWRRVCGTGPGAAGHRAGRRAWT